MKSKLNVVPYDASLQKLASDFHSGNGYLDRFLRNSLSLDDSFGKTYVFLSSNNDAIIGYYNLGTGYIEERIENSTPHKLGGSVHINCLALDERYQKSFQHTTPEGINVYLSDMLLQECFDRIFEIRKEIGFTFITLCSTRQGYKLYLRNNFYDLKGDMNFSIEEDASFNTEGDDDGFCAPMYYPLDIE